MLPIRLRSPCSGKFKVLVGRAVEQSSLHVVRSDHGAAVAAEVARRIVMPPHREGGQSRYPRPDAPTLSDGWLASLLEWAESELHRPITIADLAAHARVSVRTIVRRFADVLGLSPLQWLLQQRVRRAQQMLESTDQPVGRIAEVCSFGTPAGLRIHFTRVPWQTPGTSDEHRYAQLAETPTWVQAAAILLLICA